MFLDRVLSSGNSTRVGAFAVSCMFVYFVGASNWLDSDSHLLVERFPNFFFLSTSLSALLPVPPSVPPRFRHSKVVSGKTRALKIVLGLKLVPPKPKLMSYKNVCNKRHVLFDFSLMRVNYKKYKVPITF